MGEQDTPWAKAAKAIGLTSGVDIECIRHAAIEYANQRIAELHPPDTGDDSLVNVRRLREELAGTQKLIIRLHAIINLTRLTEDEGSISSQVQSICDLAVARIKELADTKTSLEVACAERDSLRAELDRKSRCPYIVSAEDGTQHCRLAELDGDKLDALRKALEAAVHELERVNNIKDGQPLVSHNLIHNLHGLVESAGPAPKT